MSYLHDNEVILKNKILMICPYIVIMVFNSPASPAVTCPTQNLNHVHEAAPGALKSAPVVDDILQPLGAAHMYSADLAPGKHSVAAAVAEDTSD